MDTFYMHMNNTPVGDITIVQREGRIVGLSLGKSCPGCFHRTALLESCEKQLMQYFKGERRRFDLPLDISGTAFQRRVWQAMAEIPYGETVTYGELAKSIGSPGAARAVGAACGANPIAIILPCHRVLGKNGPGGYAYGAETKKVLLKIEKMGNNY